LPDLVDTHCHLDFDWFDEDRETVVVRAFEAGVTRIVAPGINPESSRKAVALAEHFEGVYAAVGVHPNTNLALGKPELKALRALCLHPKVVAVGEIGLDYYRDHTPHERQRANLAAQLRLASEVGKPVILHDRQASEDLLAMLAEWRTDADDGLTERPGVLHTFSAGWREAQTALDLGFYLGFSGPLTYKKAEETRAVAAQAPIDRLLVETDAPFLVPQPHRGRVRRNEPAFVRHVAEKLAEVRGLSLDALAEQTTANAARLFGLPS
jgi:TatD DNase family protein